MESTLLLNASLGLLPVLLFLTVLVSFDSFKLVRFPIVMQMIAAGALAAVAAYFINTGLLTAFSIREEDYIHFGSPAVEELLKASIIALLIITNRIGFAFDSAILGFSVGAGFAVVENFYYLQVLKDEPAAIWVIRGFGTAIMHGGATAFFAVLGHVLTAHDKRNIFFKYLPGLLAAYGVHSAFNFFLAFPVTSTAALVIAAPLALTIFLREDEKTIHDWLKVDFAAHKELLDQINSGSFEGSRAGRFLKRLRRQYDERIASKIVYYVQLHTELILAAEELLSAHEEGRKVKVGDDIREKLLVLHELESEIGRTALLALRPHLHFNRHEFWELYMLEKEAGFKHPHPH